MRAIFLLQIAVVAVTASDGNSHKREAREKERAWAAYKAHEGKLQEQSNNFKAFAHEKAVREEHLRRISAEIEAWAKLDDERRAARHAKEELERNLAEDPDYLSPEKVAARAAAEAEKARADRLALIDEVHGRTYDSVLAEENEALPKPSWIMSIFKSGPPPITTVTNEARFRDLFKYRVIANLISRNPDATCAHIANLIAGDLATKPNQYSDLEFNQASFQMICEVLRKSHELPDGPAPT